MGDRQAAQGSADGGQGTDGVGQVIGPVGEAQQGGGEQQGRPEQLVDGGFLIRQPLRRTDDHRLHDQIDAQADH